MGFQSSVEKLNTDSAAVNGNYSAALKQVVQFLVSPGIKI